MKKRIFLAILCLSMIIVGGITVYAYLEHEEQADYSSGMFVDRGDTNGYATVHNLYTVI